MKGFHVKQLLSGIEKTIKCVGLSLSNCEITFEANPGATDHKDFSAFLDAGVNRLSIGAQSFNKTHLEVLGRIHSPDNIVETHQAAIRAGFTRINFDLMFGLPDQSMDALEKDLNRALSLHTDHLSLYQLTVEPNTYYYHYPPDKLPGSDRLWEMSQSINKIAGNYGFTQYEVSAHSIDKKSRSLHNLNYWQFGDYMGIGAGAHGKISRNSSGCNDLEIRRYSNHKLPKDYIQAGRPYTSQVTNVSTEDRILEFLMNGLRLKNGFDLSLFEQRTGLSLEALQGVIVPLVEKGLLEVLDNRVRTTKLGFSHLDDLLTQCLP